MAVQTGRCPACGQAPHGDAPCPHRLLAASGERVGPSCNCLPEPLAGWIACASCGLPQAPGKSFCSYCGRRWVTQVAG